MFNLKDIIDIPPFSLAHQEKMELYIKSLSDLTQYHYEKCPQYRKILDVLGYNPSSITTIEDIPFIPVRLFKEYELLSIDPFQVTKTLTSSGTTGQSVSKIFLDKITSTNQTIVLTKLVSSFVGTHRLPMLVIDTSAVVKDRNLFSARGAAIIGFSMFGHDVTYALDDRMQLDFGKIQTFLDKHKDKQILVFGFTSMIWEHFYTALKTAGISLPLESGIMIHGGGWKKLTEQAVFNDTFKKSITDVCGIEKILNYYGMVEQTGSIFIECETGHLHASIFSDLLIRDHRDFSPLSEGQEGLVQLLSLLPLSYPGHSILSEDVGRIIGEDDCLCGRKGKYFMIYGRVQNAEVRGCSDAYTASA